MKSSSSSTRDCRSENVDRTVEIAESQDLLDTGRNQKRTVAINHSAETE